MASRWESRPGHTCGPEGADYESCEGCQADYEERFACLECGTDHEGYPQGSLGAVMHCLRSRAETLGAEHLVDQVDALRRDLDKRRDEILWRCGTTAAYRRHLRRGEPPCDRCRAANAEHSRRHRKDQDG